MVKLQMLEKEAKNVNLNAYVDYGVKSQKNTNFRSYSTDNF